MALALTVKFGESIMIGDNVEIVVKRCDRGGRVILAIIAPIEIDVDRKEVRIQKEASNGNIKKLPN